jgi:hypothetical protein
MFEEGESLFIISENDLTGVSSQIIFSVLPIWNICTTLRRTSARIFLLLPF